MALSLSGDFFTNIVLLGFLFFNVGPGLMIAWIKRDWIRAFFRPQDWFEARFLSPLSGNETGMLLRYPDSGRIEFRGKPYFLVTKESVDFTAPGGEGKLKEENAMRGPSYRIGRLAAFRWIEGNMWPVDPFTGLHAEDQEVLYRFERTKLLEDFFTEGGVMEWIKDHPWIVVLGLVALGAVILFIVNKQPPTEALGAAAKSLPGQAVTLQ